LKEETLSKRFISAFTVFVFLFALGAPTWAHDLEPISTEYARPFLRGSGSWHIVYEFEREAGGERLHAIPEMEVEFGVLPRLQLNFGQPLFLSREAFGEPYRKAGGRIEAGARLLLFGGTHEGYAVSLQTEVEAPTGPSDLIGDATELGAALHIDKPAGKHLRLHSNLGWVTTVGGSERPERVFRYNNALVWRASKRWNPVVEVLGETETRTGETFLAVQPEVIFWANRHLEVKAGIPLGLNSSTPNWGFRAKLTFVWGIE
jgi:hypothetical protein